MTTTIAPDVEIASLAPNERVDDLPLLIAHLRRMRVAQTIDAVAGIPDGADLSPGWVVTLWLAHILSRGDSKAPHLLSWAADRALTLRWCVGRDINPYALSEERLRDVLAVLSNDTAWAQIERLLNTELQQAVAQASHRVRFVSAEGVGWHVSNDGLLQFHYSNTWRPGALRARITLTLLDPPGIPIATWIMPRSDEASHLTAIRHTRGCLPQPQIIYSGDAVTPLATRAAIHANHDGYLAPLTDQQIPDLLRLHGTSDTLMVSGDYELREWNEPVRALVDGRMIEWHERRIMVRSRALARAEELGLRARLAQVRADLGSLCERRRGKQRPRSLEALQQLALELVTNQQLDQILTLRYHEEIAERTVRRYRGRPTAVRVERDLSVSTVIDEAAFARHISMLGWRIYATNLPPARLPARELLRDMPEGDHGFRRLNGRSLSLSQGSLQRGDYSHGLIRLLSLARRALALIEVVAARRLQAESEQVGDSQRPTQATAERMLDAFRDISLNAYPRQRPSTTALSPLQLRILQLLTLPTDISPPS